jgi:hypothetical protein
VAKFDQGYWRIETFPVRLGESIGREVEVKVEDEDETRAGGINPDLLLYARGGRGDLGMGQTEEPTLIDFSTNVVLVGTSLVDGWTGSNNLRPRPYYEMLYSDNSDEIERLPIGSSYWPNELKNAQSQVKLFIDRRPVEDFRSFGSSEINRLLSSTTGGRGVGRRGGAY